MIRVPERPGLGMALDSDELEFRKGRDCRMSSLRCSRPGSQPCSMSANDRPRAGPAFDLASRDPLPEGRLAGHRGEMGRLRSIAEEKLSRLEAESDSMRAARLVATAPDCLIMLRN
jgi:hypothetical protein